MVQRVSNKTKNMKRSAEVSTDDDVSPTPNRSRATATGKPQLMIWYPISLTASNVEYGRTTSNKTVRDFFGQGGSHSKEYAFAVAYSVVSSLVLFYLFYPKKAEHFVYIWTSFTSHNTHYRLSLQWKLLCKHHQSEMLPGLLPLKCQNMSSTLC